MPMYEHVFLARQDLSQSQVDTLAQEATKIVEDNQDKDGIENLDIGFRVLKIDSTNMKDVYYTPDEYLQADLGNLESHIKEDRTGETGRYEARISLQKRKADHHNEGQRHFPRQGQHGQIRPWPRQPAGCPSDRPAKP